MDYFVPSKDGVKIEIGIRVLLLKFLPHRVNIENDTVTIRYLPATQRHIQILFLKICPHS